MRKLVALSLMACLAIAGAALSPPARAGVVVSVGVPVPGVVVTPPALVTPWPLPYAVPPYPGYVRFGYGVPYGYRYWVGPGARGWWGYGRWHRWR